MGSGSHTMGKYLAFKNGWDQSQLQFVVADNFDGLRNGLIAGKFHYFMWESFTTKPWVDRNEISKVADIETPWTAFSIAARKSVLSEIDQIKLFSAIRKGYIALFSCVRKKNYALKCAIAGVNIFLENDKEESIHRIMCEHGHTEVDIYKSTFSSA
jgi:hypothetical protein